MTSDEEMWSPSAEQGLLGGLMIDSDFLFDKISGMVTAQDFHKAAHRAIFEAIQGFVAAGKPVDVVLVFNALRDRTDEAGELPYLNSLAQYAPATRTMRAYAEVIREKSMTRSLVRALSEARELAHGPEPTAQKLDSILSLFSPLQKGTVKKEPRLLGDVALERAAHYEAMEAGSIVPGWPTGIPMLDRRLNGGFRPGKLYILAARPGIGKSSLSAQLLIKQAKDGRPGLMLSQEMPVEEVADRAVSSMGQIDYGAIQTGKLSDSDWANTVAMIEECRGLPIWLDDQGALTLSDIKAKVRMCKGLKVVVLDYLQLCSAEKNSSNRNGEIEEISRGLKAMAMELGLAVIMLSQLNREVEKRPNKRPLLSDLRDSGSIEQDADAVVFLWPVKDYEDGNKIVGIGIDKNRQGRTGEAALHFNGNRQHWGESSEPLSAHHVSPVKSGRGFAYANGGE
jgi:replicative DNA helicase